MRKVLSILLMISLSLTLISCTAKEMKNTKDYVETPEKPFQFAFNAFDTQCSISIYGVEDTEWAQTYASDMSDFIRKYEKILSKTIEGSDVYEINHRKSDSVMISDITANMFSLGRDMYNWSYGKFDISSGTLIDLWDVKNRKTLPSKEEIEEAKSHCANFDYEIERDVKPGELKCNRITFKGDKKTLYDLGGLGKGAMCDALKDMLSTNDKIKACIINLGGNVLCTGKLENRKGGAFNIGIYKPFSTRSEIVDTVKVVDKNVITSGIYQRYFKVKGDDRVYHHIIDPQTGYPCETGLNSVTIISDNGLLGDYLSTACMLMGKDSSMELIDFASKQFGDKNLQAIYCDTKNKVTKHPEKVKTY